MTLIEDVVVSIIVPVYNTQKYIRKCLLSIINQTYKKLDIILVDDESTDRSEKICAVFEKKDSRIRVIHSKKTGVSEARNIGIQAAYGTYLCFVDSDDWLSKTAVEKMVKCMVLERAELCYSNYMLVEVLHNSRNKLSFNKTVCSLYDKKEFVDILKQMGLGPCWKLYLKEIISKEHLEFPAGRQLGEDQIFNLQYLQFCHKIALEKDIVYYYNRLNITSITRQIHKDINQGSFEMAKVYDQLFRDSLENPVIAEFLLNKYVGFCYNACNHYVAYEKQFGNSQVKKKIEETFLLFECYLQQYADSNFCKKNRKWKILNSYMLQQDFNSLKSEIRNYSYEINLARWKRVVIAFIRNLKIAYYYQVTLHTYDYDSKRKKS